MDATSAPMDAGDAATEATAPPPPTGVDPCTMKTVTVSSDVLDPTIVYFDGTLTPGDCGSDALSHFSDPNSACLGFDCAYTAEYTQIRPTDGHLLYIQEGLLREFKADACVHAPGGMYPKYPSANDPIVPTPMCPVSGTNYLWHFQVSLDGDVYYGCGMSWYMSNGSITYTEDGVFHLQRVGKNKLALLSDGHSIKLLALDTGAVTVVNPPEFAQLSFVGTYRARDDGSFWAVAHPTTGPDDGAELWQIDPTGTATKTGSYPARPPSTYVAVQGTPALDGCGGLVELGDSEIARRDLQGRSQVVYTEASMPWVQLSISYLITGP
jgi:hypothetical protein